MGKVGERIYNLKSVVIFQYCNISVVIFVEVIREGMGGMWELNCAI